jgi:cyclophilin family peptidyl-prolyl cis-trans isomerase/HEAT repeat protein
MRSTWGGIGLALWSCAALALVDGSATEESKDPAAAVALLESLEDQRTFGEGRLEEVARASWPNVRARALLAMGRIGLAEGASPVASAMTDPSWEVREAAALAAGWLGMAWVPLPPAALEVLAQAVMLAESREKNEAARTAQLRALGQLATPAALMHLDKRVRKGTVGSRTEAAIALGVSFKRGTLANEETLGALGALMRGPEVLRHAGAYALSMSKAKNAARVLRGCLDDASSRVRALCAKGLGDTGVPDDAPGLGKHLTDADVWVSAESARSLAKLAAKCSEGGACPPTVALGKLGELVDRLAGGKKGLLQPLLAVAQQNLPRAGKGVLNDVRARLAAATPKATGSHRASLARLECRYAAAVDRLERRLEHVKACGDGVVPEAARLAMGLRELALNPPTNAILKAGEGAKAAGAATAGTSGTVAAGADAGVPVNPGAEGSGAIASPTPSVEPEITSDELLPFLHHPSASVREAALDALAVFPPPRELSSVRALLLNEDTITAAYAVAALGKWKDTGSAQAVLGLASRAMESVDLAEPVATALTEILAGKAEPTLRPWLSAPHPYVRAVAARALTSLLGTPVAPAETPTRPLSAPFVTPEPIRFELVTEVGSLVLELDDAHAPRTSDNFRSLVQRRLFDGLAFHRIVPGFVVQGGDPRGDGDGGPGYQVACEVNGLRYAPGVVGMALSGKDTGGSQFFIAETAQPHLDGRYTAFGRIVRGMELLPQLWEGTAILEIRPQ